MTQAEIKRTLHHLRYEYGYSLKKLSRLAGLSPSTISAAMTTQINEETQARLSNVLPLVPRRKQKEQKPKRKPGHLKRYLIRYYNLKGWLEVIEQEPGIEKKFTRSPERGMSRERAAYVCARYDFQMKRYLLDLFGEVLKQRKIVMADCYQAEKWIERIHAALPGLKPALFKKILQRGA